MSARAREPLEARRSETRRLARGVRNRVLRRTAAVRRRVRRLRGRRSLPLVAVAGPRWLGWLLRPDARVVRTGTLRARLPISPEAVITAAGASGTSAVRWPKVARETYDPTTRPLIQPTRSNPLVADVHPDLPEVLAARARAACRTVATPTPRGADDPLLRPWLRETALVHLAYREAHRHPAVSLIDDARGLAGRATTGDVAPEVTVVCVTNRPAFLDAALANHTRQRHDRRRLLLVLNSAAFERDAVLRRLAAVPDSTLLEVDETESLGACLNHALERCTTRYFAKFDDDDHYGAAYLEDLLIAHRYADAAVVGKHSYFARYDGSPNVHLRFPAREFAYTSFVAGGTLVLDLERCGDVRFADRSIGEDTAFLETCQRRGLGVFAADRFNYVQRRGAFNTWTLPREEYLRHAVELDPTSAAGVVDL